MNPTGDKWPFNTYGVPNSAIVAIYAISDRDEDDPWNTTLGSTYREQVRKLTAWGLNDDNVYVYNGCAGQFGADLDGNVGE